MDTKLPISPAMLDMLKRAIIDQAVHTPYSHLQGYMNRWFATADDAMAYKAEDQRNFLNARIAEGRGSEKYIWSL